jgi:protein gp37
MLNKSKVEWCDYSINPVKGLCPMDCKDNQGKPYCYARRMYQNPRYKTMYANQEIRFEPEVMSGVYLSHIKPSRIFLGSTLELFGEWVKPEWLKYIFEMCKVFPQHTFIFLTKNSENLKDWEPFPENCWVGVSVTSNGFAPGAYYGLSKVKASIRFISFEPLLGMIGTDELRNLATVSDWWILGAQTPYSKKTAPRIEWVQEILVAAHNAGNIPVFMKNNLQPVIDHDFLWSGWKLRQKMPQYAPVRKD